MTKSKIECLEYLRFWALRILRVLPLILLVFVVSNIACSYTRVSDAEIYVVFRNNGDEPIVSPAVRFQLRLPETYLLTSSNVTISYDSTKLNLSVEQPMIVSIYIKLLEPKQEAKIVVRNIIAKIEDLEAYDRIALGAHLEYYADLPSGLEIRVALMVYGDLLGFRFPVYSYTWFSDEPLGESIRNRMWTMLYLWIPLIFAITAIIIVISGERKPWTTVILANIVVLLYIFLGNGWDILIKNDNYGLLLAAVGVFLHGDYWHITGNIPFFIMTGVVIEKFVIPNLDRGSYGFIKYYLYPTALWSAGNMMWFIPMQFFSIGLSCIIIILNMISTIFIFEASKKGFEFSGMGLFYVFLTGLAFWGLFGWIWAIPRSILHLEEETKALILIHIFAGFLSFMWGVAYQKRHSKEVVNESR
mgnify:CR=1 FL=1